MEGVVREYAGALWHRRPEAASVDDTAAPERLCDDDPGRSFLTAGRLPLWLRGHGGGCVGGGAKPLAGVPLRSLRWPRGSGSSGATSSGVAWRLLPRRLQVRPVRLSRRARSRRPIRPHGFSGVVVPILL